METAELEALPPGHPPRHRDVRRRVSRCGAGRARLAGRAAGRPEQCRLAALRGAGVGRRRFLGTGLAAGRRARRGGRGPRIGGPASPSTTGGARAGPRWSVRGAGPRDQGSRPGRHRGGRRRDRRGPGCLHGEGLRPRALRHVRGLDPWLGLVEVTADLDAGATRPVDWAGAASLGQLALGHELVGLARAMLEARPAPRPGSGPVRTPDQLLPGHSPPPGREPGRARGGRRAAGRRVGRSVPGHGGHGQGDGGSLHTHVARHAQQVLAGIGFTTEHPLHRYVRRTIVLDQLLGASSVLTAQLGEDVLERATLPPTFPL